MKITSFLCTYNDCEYLDATLESFKHVPDKLYIIEGSWGSAQSYKDTPKRSSIETYNIIDKHVDNKKVFLIQANEENETQQRQIGLEKAQEDGADWCWMLDSDEVYTEKGIAHTHSELLKQNESPYLKTVKLESYNFINSFNRYYEGLYNRIFRVTEEAKFIFSNEVIYDQAVDGRIPGKVFYHYNYVKKDPEQFLRKMHYCGQEDKYFEYVQSKKYGCVGHNYKIPEDISIYDFAGKHPKIMKTHPNLVNNIYNDGNIQFE